MSQVPQIVRQKLQPSEVPREHPDADMLTAFSERALLSSERAVVMEHLARCGDCREIVALALPESESITPPEPVSVSGRGWLGWPGLRWGFALAGIAVVGAIGVVEYQHRDRSAQMAVLVKQSPPIAVQPAPAVPSSGEKNAQPQVLANENLKSSQTSASTASTSPVLRDRAQSSPQIPKELTADANGVSSGSGVVGGRVSTGEAEANASMSTARTEVATTFSPSAPAAPAAKPQATASNSAPRRAPAQQMSEMVEVQSQGTTVASADQGQNSTAKQLDLPRAQQQRASNDPIYFHAEGDKEMSRAKAPVAASPENASSAYPVAPIPASVSGRSTLSLSAPTWSIASNGHLQRSFDGGKAWEDVDVNHLRLISSHDLLSAGALAKDSRAAETSKEGKKEKTDAVDATRSSLSAVIFRAVSANGFDVWAGGSAGALYHSVDGGNQWIRVFPTVNSVVLTGDIASIQFSDADHGSITTVTGEIWNTSDGGHSWQKN